MTDVKMSFGVPDRDAKVQAFFSDAKTPSPPNLVKRFRYQSNKRPSPKLHADADITDPPNQKQQDNECKEVSRKKETQVNNEDNGNQKASDR